MLANWREQWGAGVDFKSVLFEDLCGWLQLILHSSYENSNTAEIEDLREQLCTGFFCVYLQDQVAVARKLLVQARPLLPQEMFLSLGSQIPRENPANTGSFLVRVQVIFGEILGIFKAKFLKLFEFLQKQPVLFLAFCAKLVNLIVQKIQ